MNIELFINGYNKCKEYLEKADLVVFILIVIIILYFLMYLISFFFKLPVIILGGLLIGYYLHKNNKIKII